ncbi:MAG: zf-HC2 domain-containing protein [Acidobacteriota bacterium]
MMGFGPDLEHETYEELCALATAGALSAAEQERLTAHLESCAACREALEQYQQIAGEGMPFLAGDFVPDRGADAFEESPALHRLLQAAGGEADPPAPFPVAAQRKPVSHSGWVRGLVAACLVMSVGAGAYWAGAGSANVRLRGIRAASRSTLDRTAAEKQALETAMQTARERIAVLEQQAIGDQKDAEKLRAQADADTQRIAAMTAAMEAARTESDTQLAALRQEHDADAGKLRDAEKMYQGVQYELNALRNQHRQDLVREASLQASADGLSEQLSQQSGRARADEHYLADDKDIRDLIGARNLYIADIMDVNDTGQSRKPFGRVFYTKTKSLIFYAYDLDRQPGVRRTSTFQVWGRTGSRDRNPVNLGILYMDSATNRRWTLRVDNPEQLARLDSVFVTIEPHEQTERPTGKPFLYASLQRVPNHP